MSRIVADTDVASYIFNWHSSAQRYVDILQGSELVLSFMSVAELRMGAISAGWGSRRRELLEQFIGRFGATYADDALCTSWATLRANARASGLGVARHTLSRVIDGQTGISPEMAIRLEKAGWSNATIGCGCRRPTIWRRTPCGRY